MIGTSNHEDAIIRLKAVHFVEEIAPHAIRDERVQVFKNEIARSELSSKRKYLLDGILRAKELQQSLVWVRLWTGLVDLLKQEFARRV